MKNLRQINQIKEQARRGGLSHAWLLIGPRCEAGDETASFLASALLCGGDSNEIPCGRCIHCRKVQKGIHPDLIKVEHLPDKRELLVDQVREMAKEAYILPNEAGRKVFIIEEADTLNTNAQNAMLKLLEEPPAYAAFILMAINPGSLYDTVRSRCVEINIPEDSGEVKRRYSELSEELAGAFISHDGLSLVRAFAKAEKADREAFDCLIDELYAVSVNAAKESEMQDRQLRCMKLASLADRLHEMRSFNVGTGHCLGLILSEF